MKVERVIPILNVSNIQESFAWFEKIGWKKGWDWGEPPADLADETQIRIKKVLTFCNYRIQICVYL